MINYIGLGGRLRESGTELDMEVLALLHDLHILSRMKGKKKVMREMLDQTTTPTAKQMRQTMMAAVQASGPRMYDLATGENPLWEALKSRGEVTA